MGIILYLLGLACAIWCVYDLFTTKKNRHPLENRYRSCSVEHLVDWPCSLLLLAARPH